MKMRKKRTAKKSAPVLELRLYVVNTNARSALAKDNLRRLCEELRGPYKITVIDLLEQPELARQDQITAIPTLVRTLPGPKRSVIGSLSDTRRVLNALEVSAEAEQLDEFLAASGCRVGAA